MSVPGSTRCMIPLDHPLASIRGATNAIFIEGPSIDELLFAGPGAGGAPTATAVLGDVIDAARENPRRGTGDAAYPVLARRSVPTSGRADQVVPPARGRRPARRSRAGRRGLRRRRRVASSRCGRRGRGRGDAAHRHPPRPRGGTTGSSGTSAHCRCAAQRGVGDPSARATRHEPSRHHRGVSRPTPGWAGYADRHAARRRHATDPGTGPLEGSWIAGCS